MSKEYITWQEAAITLNKSDSHSLTDWPTKSQLLTMGANSILLQKYATTDFVAEEDVRPTASKDIILLPLSLSETAKFTDYGLLNGRHNYEYSEVKFPAQANPTGIRLLFKVTSVGDIKEDITASCPVFNNVEVLEVEMPPIGVQVTFDLVNSHPGSTHDFAILLQADGISASLVVIIHVV